ncbi:DUF6048 family protein [Alloprevotella rava]|uniref:Outer membrane protein beta-barrel domain-containing protein n=1 Tax=Alloprevotella rava TaxID=671218 RepID=A0A7W5XXZ7_9BACT|nr:DUF6048 family protein [Alloprevotella rava]MBB3702680.1 hypothetical protein [Alloprevotella rava]
MRILRIFVFSCVLLSSCALSAAAMVRDTIQTQPRPIALEPATKKEPLLAGCSVGFDVCGTVMALATPFGQYEGMFRVNLKKRFFPTAELGLGVSNHTDETSNIKYKTASPYLRLGVDYNFLKDRHSENRLFGGIRFAYTSYKFDLSAPDLKDPIYGTTVPFNLTGIKGNMLWSEVMFGVEAKIWKFFHVGWSVRYKLRLHESKTEVDNAWYVPGYGRYGSNGLGGSFNVVFDI